jgi:hypothetical protein
MWTTLQRLMGRRERTTMETHNVEAARARLVELEAEWNALTQRITDGTASPQDYEDRPGLLSRVQAAREALEALETRERRAAMAVRDADLRGRIDATSREVATLVGRLQLALVDLRALEAEIYAGGLVSGGHVEDITGLPSGFGESMLRAIATAAPDTQWPHPLPGAPDERAGRRPERLGRIRDPRTETALPYGTSGVVDLATGTVHVGGLP